MVNHLFPKENPLLLEEGVGILLKLFFPTQPKDFSMQYHVSLMRMHFIYYAFEEPMLESERGASLQFISPLL
jgi:hypothetical protein